MSEQPATSTASDKPNSNSNEDGEGKERMFECNICLETAKDAVISLCGHLFCWPCLHQWLETRPQRQLCPVCKAAISKDKVIPLYGRGNSDQQDPRAKVPPRPQGQRTEPESTGTGFPGFTFGEGGFHLSFGIGAFPFGLLASSLNFTGEHRPAGRREERVDPDEMIPKIFLWIAALFLLWIIFT